MIFDADNPVVALCAEGMAVAGDVEAAADCFRRAWAARTDDHDAAIAAHYLARVQPTATDKLAWDARAVAHAEAALDAGDERVRPLLASLYLNHGDGLLAAERHGDAREAVRRAETALTTMPDDGYRAFVAGGVARLRQRADAPADSRAAGER